MRALDAGEAFVVTRNGVAVGELTPVKRRRFANRDAVLAAFRESSRVDAVRLREDVDSVLDQNPHPRE